MQSSGYSTTTLSRRDWWAWRARRRRGLHQRKAQPPEIPLLGGSAQLFVDYDQVESLGWSLSKMLLPAGEAAPYDFVAVT